MGIPRFTLYPWTERFEESGKKYFKFIVILLTRWIKRFEEPGEKALRNKPKKPKK